MPNELLLTEIKEALEKFSRLKDIDDTSYQSGINAKRNIGEIASLIEGIASAYYEKKIAELELRLIESVSPNEAREAEASIRREVLEDLAEYIRMHGKDAVFPEEWQSQYFPRWQSQLKKWGIKSGTMPKEV